MNNLNSLNPTQKEAVLHHSDPAVVYAGAGSGKTRVICTRIAWLIQEKGVPSYAVLAVTFTNKAAKEMRERIEALIGNEQSKYLTISTFHSFCTKFLRIYAHEIGFSSSFSIFDEDDQKNIIKNALKKLNISDKIISVATVKSKIDKIKNKGFSVEDYGKEIRENQESIFLEKKKSFESFGEQYDPELVLKIYEYYQKILLQQNAMDFNDLLLNFVKLIETKEHVLKALQERFSYFLVDEFQDTNMIQFKLISLLSSATKNIFIVGDDDQSIYSWRGAEPSFIINFDKIYRTSKIYKLEENYRSSDVIIKAASALINHNKNRAKKTLFTSRCNGEKILTHRSASAQIEANFVANKIYAIAMDKEKKFSDFCILYRTNSQSRSLEDELRRRMIPYVIYGSVRFYERAEIKIVMQYLKLLTNPSDDTAFEKVVNTPRRSFGDSALGKLTEMAFVNQTTLLQAAVDLSYGNSSNYVTRSLNGLKTFANQYQKWKTQLENNYKVSDIFTSITEDIRLQEYLRAAYPEEFEERWLNILEFKNALVEHELKERPEPMVSLAILSEFIEQAMLSIEPTMFNVKQGQADAVTLMTIHAAKGLEFDTVIICGLEEGVLPHQNSLYDPDSLEEERRLMYVAITRAKNKLILTHINSNRYKVFLPAQPSRFLSEIPKECLEK